MRASEIRQRLNEISGLEGEAFTDEIRQESDRLTAEFRQVETKLRAAITAEGEPEVRTVAAAPDAEERERIELRSRASLTQYLLNAVRGKAHAGVEAELNEAAGISADGIPLELWDVPQPAEERAVAAAPGTVGVNLDQIRPFVFANSIAPRLGIEMPRVVSGTYASATITTAQSAAAKAKSAAAEGVAGAFSVTTATPKRISARLELTLEDIAAVGQANFEPILRQNLSLALSDELDDQAINGAGADNDLNGIFQRLTDPAAPAAQKETWKRFLTIQSSGIDGLWASELQDVAMVVNPETYRLAATTFQGNDSEESAAAYMKRVGGGFWTNKRMPDKANHIAQGILYRKGRMMQGGSGAMRTAVCPHWNEIGIDDIYSGSAKGERYFTLHVIVGDVILVQPDAYKQVAFRVSS